MKEIYKDIEGYEGLYQISNLGNVKSLNYRHTGKEKVLICRVNGGGYLYVDLHKNRELKTFKVHRLVAQAFIPNPENKPCVDHINTIKNDNRVENLRWCTQKENCNNELTKQKRLENQNNETTKQKMSLAKKGKHWKLENGKRVWY